MNLIIYDFTGALKILKEVELCFAKKGMQEKDAQKRLEYLTYQTELQTIEKIANEISVESSFSAAPIVVSAFQRQTENENYLLNGLCKTTEEEELQKSKIGIDRMVLQLFGVAVDDSGKDI